jgi:hypothetical protein
MKHALVLLVLLALPARIYADTNSDKAIVMMEQVASLIDANKGNCDVMGDKLSAWSDANSAHLGQLIEATKTLSPDQKKAFSAKVKAISTKMMAGLQACSSNAKVTAVVKKLMTPN